MTGLTHKGASGGERGNTTSPAEVDLWRQADVSAVYDFGSVSQSMGAQAQLLQNEG